MAHEASEGGVAELWWEAEALGRGDVDKPPGAWLPGEGDGQDWCSGRLTTPGRLLRAQL